MSSRHPPARGSHGGPSGSGSSSYRDRDRDRDRDWNRPPRDPNPPDHARTTASSASNSGRDPRERRDYRDYNDTRSHPPPSDRHNRDYSSSASRHGHRDRSRSPPRHHRYERNSSPPRSSHALERARERDRGAYDRNREGSPPPRRAREVTTSSSSRKEDDSDARPSGTRVGRTNEDGRAQAKDSASAGRSTKAANADEDGELEEDDPDQAMMAALGFGGFVTTKGKKVNGNEAGGSNVKKERTWRQYMNRKGGFNRVLEKI